LRRGPGGYAKIVVEKLLNAGVGGAQIAPQTKILLMVVAQERPCEFKKIRVGFGAAGGLSERCQLEVDIAGELVFSRNRAA
jgi:hypothetical protein